MSLKYALEIKEIKKEMIQESMILILINLMEKYLKN